MTPREPLSKKERMQIDRVPMPEQAAELRALPLATLDRRLARATGPRCRFLLPPLT